MLSGFESKETVAAERTSTDWKGEKGTFFNTVHSFYANSTCIDACTWL